MNNRRRLMMIAKEEQGLVEDGLLFWCDGLNNVQGGGYSSSASNWYAYKTAASLNGFYLYKQGTVNTLNNGFQLPYDANYPKGGLISSSNPLLALSGNTMTFIIVASNLRQVGRGGGVIELTKLRNEYSKRQAIAVGENSTHCYTIRGYSDTSWSSSSVIASSTSHTGIFVYSSNGYNGTLITIINGNYTKEAYHKAFSKDSDSALRLIVGGYAYYPLVNSYNSPGNVVRSNNNWNDYPGTYHACLLYNRCLNDTEITRVISYLKTRYGLN